MCMAFNVAPFQCNPATRYDIFPFRRCLSELFNLPGETEALGVAAHTLALDEKPEVEISADIEPDYTFAVKPKQRGRKKKSKLDKIYQANRFYIYFFALARIAPEIFLLLI